MAENSSNPEPEEGADQKHNGGEHPLVERSAGPASRFSRSTIDSSFEEFLKHKEKKRSEGNSPLQSKRGRSCRLKSRNVQLKPVSKKGKKKQQEYAAASKKHYSNDENKRCALCGTNQNLSIHHSK